MPPSVRSFSILKQRRKAHNAKAAKNRAEAVRLMAIDGVSVRIAAAQSDVSVSICYQPKRLIEENDQVAISRLLKPVTKSPGRRPHLTTQHQNMIVRRLPFPAKRGFAADVQDLTMLMGSVAALSGRPFKNGVPSDESVLLFRSQHRGISFRNYEAKDLAKFKGENFEHVERTVF